MQYLYLLLSIGMLYYKEGWNISFMKNIKVLISWPIWEIALREFMSDLQTFLTQP
jgi:hypothetical protein